MCSVTLQSLIMDEREVRGAVGMPRLEIWWRVTPWLSDILMLLLLSAFILYFRYLAIYMLS
jgi:hypothetical protein